MTAREQATVWAWALLGDECLTESFAVIRWRNSGGMRQRLVPIADPDALADGLMRVAVTAETFLGVCARATHDGGGAGVRRAHVLWADCDSPDAVVALDAFEPRPSMRVASSTGRAHAYWCLTRPLDADGGWIERANRRLAHALGADAAVADRGRIMRAPGTINHKHGERFGVELTDLHDAIYGLRDVVGHLSDPPTWQPLRAPRVTTRDGGRSPLDAVPAAVYIAALTGREPDRSGKVACPFHNDRVPSLHVYSDPADGWWCFGCERGGTIIDFAAALYGIEPRGSGFHAIRRRLADDLLGAVA